MTFKIFRRLNLLLHLFLFGVLFFILTSTTSAQVPAVDCNSPDNLVVNGCFEEPIVPDSGSGGTGLFTVVPGWTLAKFSAIGSPCLTEFELQRDGQDGVASYEGVQFGEFDSGCSLPVGPSAQVVSIAQTITTIPYHTYEVSFAYRRAPTATPADSMLVFEWNNVEYFNQPAPADWEIVTLEIIAESTSTELYFVDPDLFPDFYGTLIDDVSVIDLGVSCVIDPDNLVMNGCFEVPMITEPIFQFFTAGQVPGWNMEQFPASVPICPTTFFEIQVEQNAMTAYEGNQFAEFESGCDSGFASQSTSIFQTIDTLPSHRYEVSFAGGGTAVGEFIRVEWNDDIIFDQTMALGWAIYSTEVIADSTETVVKFSEPDDTPDFVGAVIDNIRVVDLGPVYGDLVVNKDAQYAAGDPLAGAEFEICITGLSFPSGDCQTISNLGGELTWNDLLVGDYTVTETPLDEGLWFTDNGSSTISIAENQTGQVDITNIYFPPEPEPAQTCISLASYYASNPSIDGVFLNGLVAVSTSQGQTRIIQTGAPPTGYDTYGEDNFSATGYVIFDPTTVHDYAFTFSNSIIVSDFSLRLHDFGDQNESGTTAWSAELFSSDVTEGDRIAYNFVEVMPVEGDAFSALPGFPGNRRFAISGTDIRNASMNFDHNGNNPYLYDGISRYRTSADPGIGLDELCITYTPRYGELEVTKAVDWLGTPVNMAVEFEICITGPSYPSGDCFRFDGDGGTHLWDTLIPGEYTVLETLPGSDWVVTQPANPVVVSPGGTASAYVLNRLALGSVQATKSVNWNGVDVDGAQSFTLCINGALLNNIPDCQVVGANGGTVTWGELIPGNYSVYEYDPGSQWSASGGGSVGVLPGQTTFTTITNTHTPPVTITPPPTCVHDLRLDLTGVLTNGDISGQVTNNGAESCTYPIGIASYSMFDGNIDNQIIFDASTASVTIAPGQTVDIGPISLPACSAQVDLFYGDLITPQFNGARYGSRLLAATVVNRGNYCTP